MISWGQFLSLLLLGRIFTAMTYIPLTGEGYSMPTQMIAILISTVIQILLILPLLAINKKYPSVGMMQILKQASPLIGAAFSIIYAIFFIIAGVSYTTHFIRFISTVLFPATGNVILIAALIAVCIYAAFLGIKGIARFGSIMLAMFVAMLVFMVLGNIGSINMLNYQPAYDIGIGSNMLPAVAEDLSRSFELLLVVALMSKVRLQARKGFFGYLTGKIVVLEVMLFLIITVLGGYAGLVDFPFFTVGAYSKIGVMQRLDAFYQVVWSLIAVVNISLFISCSAGMISEAIPKAKYTKIISGTVIAIISAFILSRHYIDGFKIVLNIGTIISLVTLMPLFVLIISSIKLSSKRKRGSVR